MPFTHMSINGVGCSLREISHTIQGHGASSPSLRIFSEVSDVRTSLERDLRYELGVVGVTAMQAESLANAFAEYAKAVRDWHAQQARERGEDVAEDSHGVQQPTPESVLAGGGE